MSSHDISYQAENLTFAYGKKKVIDDLSLTLETGKITTLIGANGCGKSTLFQLMTKNLKPNGGKLTLYGKELSGIKLKEFAKQTAIVHQYNTAPPDLSVEKLVGYGRIPHHSFGMTGQKEEDEEKIRWAMEVTNVAKYKDNALAKLSGGQKQRAFIAMALAQDTKILFLDEPTTYLDIRYQLDILKLIKRLNQKYHITIVMVLHDINQAFYYSDEILAMKNGKIIRQGKPEEVITSELLKEVYGVELKISSADGKPYVLIT